MKFQLQALRITLSTNHGPYGVTSRFTEGLNVIRAENTSGKSALINSILYALGIEVLVGKRGVEALKPVLRTTGEYAGVEFQVLDSFVELEICNSSRDVITIRRYMAGDRDNRLIEVLRGPFITSKPEGSPKIETYFVGIEGAAQRERGFHRFLSVFLEFELPFVKRFQGEDVPLYIECIAPLMLIEQIRGWSGIQATLPQSYGIRNVARLAVEYLLRLDVIENEKKRIRITEEAGAIKTKWAALCDSMTYVCTQMGGRLINVPTNPVLLLPDDPWISVSYMDNDNMPFAEMLVAKRLLLIEKEARAKKELPEESELESTLDAQETQLLVSQADLSQLRMDISAQENEQRKLEERKEFLNADILRNKDIKRLRDFGAAADMSMAHDRCPTCNQSIQDSLIPLEDIVMGIEDTLSFLVSEAEAVNLLISAGDERLSYLRGVMAGKQIAVSELRSTIRDLRTDLLENRDLSFAIIREQVHLQEEIARFEQLRDEFDDLVGKLRSLIDEWKMNRSKSSELPGEYFSAQDRSKLDALSNMFGQYVSRFGYRSTDVARLHISEDNYRPVCDEFDILAGASASDNIRVLWAYTLALFQVSQSYQGNHWGFIIFDEPEQQRMRDTSSDKLFSEIGQMPARDFQVIVATSTPADETSKRLSGFPHNLLEYGEKVIRPLQSS